jgi:cytidylate kinase
MIVAIDGPAGAGKSTLARRLAERLGFAYVDTGAMYRALAWLALERDLDPDDEQAVAALAAENSVSFQGERVLAGGRDVTVEIRTTRVDRVVSAVAGHAEVRSIMRERQRELATGDAVVEGRDIGTVVCPAADVKIYLVADPGERAQRRRSERPGEDPDALAGDLRRRDERDAAQTRPAEDAEIVDTTSLDADAVLERAEQLVRARMGS